MGRLFLTMMAGFAEFERDVISERTTSALRFKRSNGQVYNGQAAYGLNAVDGALVPNTSEQRVLERMRTLRSQGESYQGIANELNDEGIPAKLGGLWHPFAVQKILNQKESK
jgi:site-specific DNA recombinase